MSRRLLSHTHGTVLIEMAFVLPILLILALPLIDWSRLILTHQKVIKTAATMADMIALSTPITASTNCAAITSLHLEQNSTFNFLQQSGTMMRPMPTRADNPYVVVTAVQKKVGAGTVVMWQMDNVDNIFYKNRTTRIGEFNDPSDRNTAIATLAGAFGPAGSMLKDNESVIAVEANYDFTPITPFLAGLNIPFLAPHTIRHVAFYPARNGDLSYICPTFRP